MNFNFQFNVICLCGATISCDPRRSGRRVRCPDCGETLVVPGFAVRDSATETYKDVLDPDAFLRRAVDEEVAAKVAAQKVATAPTFDAAAFFARRPNPIARRIRRRSSRRLKKYRVVNLLAEGGMGTVSLARDDEMERTVAVKELKPAFRDNLSYQMRFVAEAKITGCLEHPGIAPVYELDLDESGTPFYAMRKIDGVTFEKAFAEYGVRRSPKRLKELLRHFVSACQTVVYAHSVGVIHRDVKPANIMIGQFDTTFVMDWGLAKKYEDVRESSGLGASSGFSDASSGWSDARSTRGGRDSQAKLADENGGDGDENDDGDDSLKTRVNARVGTRWYRDPDYLKTGVSKPCNDVYAFGVVLYELLTGEKPYAKMGMNEKTAFVMASPIPPSAKLRSVPRPLSAVCMKALEKKPEDRYPSVERLADDVRRWLENEPVSVWRYGFFDRLWRRFQ